MRDISFFSDNTYVSIPNSKTPRVILAVGNKAIAKNSFKIYNPFSLKAKVFKKVVQFFAINFNALFKSIFKIERKKKSDFIQFLNTKFQLEFTSSIYNATLKDKVVIQLQANKKVFGYVKYPLNKIGLKNIENEINAIKLLSKHGVLDLQMQCLHFSDTPFFILPELQGNIATISDLEIENLLNSYKKEDLFKLSKQARVLEIKKFFIDQCLNNELKILDQILNSSQELYYEVYEHGDFAPWNIVKTKTGLAAFDYEYFTEKGLEYFDLIKYHFQVGRLLKGKDKQELFNYVKHKIQIKEVKEMVSLFLLKEIMSAKQQQKSFDFETQMLNFIYA